MSLTAWLEAALVKFADRIALGSQPDTGLTYRGLDARSAFFARFLLTRGAGAGQRIVLHAEKNQDTIVALLGILRAGAAYVPLDVRLPPARKEALLRILKPALVLDSEKHPAADFLGNLPSVRLDELAGAEPATPVAIERPPGSPEDPAYFLFTSGSTGLPKAVEIPQRAAHAFASWAGASTGLVSGDAIASVTGLHFDLSTYDLFAGLGAGARVGLVPAGVLTFPAQLARTLEDGQYSALYAVPSTLSLLAEHGLLEKRNLSRLRILIAAGDRFPVQAARTLRARTPQCRIFNFYGPTETNVCTFFEVPADFPPDSPIPIGQPAAGDDCAVLADDGQLSASGKGELLVAGPTVMTGYLGEAELNKNCFLSHGGRSYYRTGDLVDRAPGGDFHYHGRHDGQVKSWGHRVHPHEVELALAALEGVAECVVVALPDPRAGHLLYALAVLKESSVATADSLEAGLREKLPSQFLPASLRLTESLPHNRNGKVDRPAVVALLQNAASLG